MQAVLRDGLFAQIRGQSTFFAKFGVRAHFGSMFRYANMPRGSGPFAAMPIRRIRASTTPQLLLRSFTEKCS